MEEIDKVQACHLEIGDIVEFEDGSHQEIIDIDEDENLIRLWLETDEHLVCHPFDIVPIFGYPHIEV